MDTEELERLLLEYLDYCAFERTPARVEEFGDLLPVPVWTARRHLKRRGETLLEALRATQLTRAVSLLQVTDLSMREIMVRCGYGSERHFYREFRRRKGRGPSTFR